MSNEDAGDALHDSLHEKHLRDKLARERDIGIGHNRPPADASMVTEQMRGDYLLMTGDIEQMLAAARIMPVTVEDDETMGVFAKLIKRLRDQTKVIEASHAKEKAPYLRGGQAVDQFFFGLWDKVARRDRKNKPGAADILQGRLDDYNQRKLRAEQERRIRWAEERRREEEERFRAEQKARREAEEARLAAERARKPETIADKSAVADAAEAAASAAKIEAAIAAERATDAHIASLARPADIVRTRVEEGPLITMVTEGYAEVVDAAKLDKEALWAFITLDAKEKALRAWARNTGYTQPMIGAAVGKRPKSAVR